MSSQGNGYGPIPDTLGTIGWIVAALAFSGIGGIIVAVASGFLAGLFLA